jgi:DeoR/GlpR family transcriptional regulator of sugar metabolism
MSETDDRARLRKAERQDLILSSLRASATLRVSEIASEFGVSTETIRRDLDELTERGLINRTYGGAVRSMAIEPALAQRQQIMVREREAIAVRASALIRPNDVVAIGAGATTLHVARRIAADHRNITVITHAFDVATSLAENPSITTLVCPGEYSGPEGCVWGAETVAFLERFNVNIAILGATGLTLEGANEANVNAAAVYRTMVERALESVIVADHTKFNRPALSVYASWHRLAKLISDTEPPAPLRDAIARHSAECVVASPSAH